jgi:hypothetical protein
MLDNDDIFIKQVDIELKVKEQFELHTGLELCENALTIIGNAVMDYLVEIDVIEDLEEEE